MPMSSASPTKCGSAPSWDTYLQPFLSPDVDALEVGPGYGRWTEFMVGCARSLTLVDVGSTCIEACRHRFGDELPAEAFVVNDGRSLPVVDSSLDLVWSFGTFVLSTSPRSPCTWPSATGCPRPAVASSSITAGRATGV